MLETLPATKFLEWQAYFMEEGFPDERQEIEAAKMLILLSQGKAKESFILPKRWQRPAIKVDNDKLVEQLKALP
jgi:hypothetical protein